MIWYNVGADGLDLACTACSSSPSWRGTLHAEARFHQGKPLLPDMAVRPDGCGLDFMARLSAGYDPMKVVADIARAHALNYLKIFIFAKPGDVITVKLAACP